jgi:hypothetical protein
MEENSTQETVNSLYKIITNDKSKSLLEDLNPNYLFIPTGDPKDFAIALKHRPNFFIRLMQRLILGFMYIPIAEADKLWR